MTVLPVRISGQAKPLINSVPRCYPPPRTWSRLVALPPEPPTCLAWLSAASVASRCEPILAFPLLPGPSTCPAWLSAASTSARCESFLAFPLPPGPSACPAWPSAASVAARYEPFSENRLTPAPCNSGSWPGAMAVGAREQAASCDAFVLSRRPPAPGAPPSRTSPACLVAKSFPEPSPTLSEPRPGDLLAGTAAANSVGLGQGHPFQRAFWPWAVRPTGSGREGRSRASCSESSAGPPVMTEADGKLRATPVVTALKL